MAGKEKAKSKAAGELTDRQQRFAEEYLVDMNGAAAYKRAGYAAKSEKTACVNASRMLRNAKVKSVIDQLQAARSIRTQATADRTLQELELLAYSDLGNIIDFTGNEYRMKPPNQITPEARRTLASVKVKRYVEGKGDDARTVEVLEFKQWSKDSALEKLGRHKRLFNPEAGEDGKDPFKVYVSIDINRV